MSLENVKRYLETEGIGEKLIILEQSSATVEEAAEAIGCEPKQIAKTMSFLADEKPILIVCAGDARVDNKKFKSIFHQKAKMIPGDLVEEYTGHAPGGVCPFAVKPGVTVYLDISLKRFERVYPAGGNGHSAVNLTIAELEKYAGDTDWVDVCRDWDISYTQLKREDIARPLFDSFQRRQEVTKCWRKEEGQWVIKEEPFVDDWGEDEYKELVCQLKNIADAGGFVCGAFAEGKLKGFVSVEASLMGSRGQYRELSFIYVSSDMRRRGIGKELFLRAVRFARERNTQKLYISAHSAVESQAFYRGLGCVDAAEYSKEHVEKEPYDCQLEFALDS